jgi:hypothetical protein
MDLACRRISLPPIHAVLDEALTVAGQEQLSYQGFLAELPPLGIGRGQFACVWPTTKPSHL